MIRRLKYSEIDFEKYSECLNNSEQRKYSATKDFLDAAAGKNWEILMYDDYKAIMPVHYIKKWGFKLVVNPKLCQQLGIFSEKDNVEINDIFLSYFERNYTIYYYAFNAENKFSTQLDQRQNFIIYPDNYETVRQKYSPKRKRKLRLDEEVLRNSEIREVTMEESFDFISKNMIGAKDEKAKKEFLQTFANFESRKYLKLIAFFYYGKIINTIAVFCNDETIALLGTFNDKEYIKLSGSSIIIDYIISQNIQNKIFDFEGSEVPSIEEFFRGFRPEKQKYPVIYNSKKDVLRKLVRF